MKVYVVKHLPTGKFLPPVKSCKSTTDRDLSDIPRVFYRTNDAIAAGRWWAAGVAYGQMTRSFEGYENYDVITKAVKGRNLSDLRVVTMTLTYAMADRHRGTPIKPWGLKGYAMSNRTALIDRGLLDD